MQFEYLVQLLTSVWMIEQNFIQTAIPFLAKALTGNADLSIFTRKEPFQIDIPGLVNFQDNEARNKITRGSLALHPMQGVIFADKYYGFSTKRFTELVNMAEADDRIAGHLVYANSPGGEVHYLDIASKAVASAKKPLLVHFERSLASAAFYINSGAKEIYATSPFDRVGSIGTMMSYLDFVPMFEKFGAKNIEVYATGSDMKNKDIRELLQGNPDEFRTKILDPLNEAFITAVKTNRPQIERKNPQTNAFRGEIYFAKDAISEGLIDGIQPLEASVDRLYTLAAIKMIKK